MKKGNNIFSAAAFSERYLAYMRTGRDKSVCSDDLVSLSPGQDADIWKNAAVLVGVVDYGDDARVIFTERSSALRNHSGQISFPGGRCDDNDLSAIHTALREAREEIALDAHAVNVLGPMPSYLTGTGYRIEPVVGIVAQPQKFTANPQEVAAIFDVPLSFLMTSANYEIQSREIRGIKRRFYVIQYQDRFIWGATAGIIRMLYERLYG